MKKHLLSLAIAAALVPSFSADAQGKLTELWRVSSGDYTADWDGNAPDWNSANAIKAQACSRFAHGRDGKMYTINMKTMSITEITRDGFVDRYKLPSLEGRSFMVGDVDTPDYYGTALSIDDAGNFLIGHMFTKAPYSSTIWSIFNPNTGEIKHFDLGVPDDYTVTLDGKDYSGIGRIDIVGRVVGDLTKGAVFYIAPQSTFAPSIRIVSCFGNGTIANANMAADKTVPIYLGTPEKHNICQPKYETIEETRMGNLADGCYFSSCEGGKWDVAGTFVNGVPDYTLQNTFRAHPGAKTNGFDTFVIEGRRYFVHNYLTPDEVTELGVNLFTMNIAIYNENGQIVATWKNNDYASVNGYCSITAETIDDGSANIYVYKSDIGNIRPGYSCCTAAMLNFKPLSLSEMPGSEENPIRINNPQDLIDMRGYLNVGDNYISLERDIDMTGVPYTVPMNEADFGKKIHFEGNYHVIRNLTVEAGNASLFGALSGEVKNLGMENVNLNMTWYCVGGIAGVVNDAVIDNCYVTGRIRGAASGGLVGATSGPLTITNSYSTADIIDTTENHSGGLVGRVDADLEIRNAYASGTVTGGQASGIATVRHAGLVKLIDVIAWNDSVNGTVEANYICAGGDYLDKNVLAWSEMQVNKEAIGALGVSATELQNAAKSWDAYSDKLVDGMPVLKWQNGEIDGVAEIETDADADVAPVYYNLQGVRVEHPANGLFIVKRGNKVTKEIIR